MKSLLAFVAFVGIVYLLGAFAFTNTLDKAFNYTAPPEPPRCLYTMSLHYNNGEVEIDTLNMECGREFVHRWDDGHEYILSFPVTLSGARVYIHNVTHFRMISIDTLKQ